MDESELLETAQLYAEKEGISVQEVLGRIEKNMNLYNSPLPPKGRLAYVEGLLKSGTIGPNLADMIIRINHIPQEDILEEYEAAKSTLSDYGIKVPDYTVKFDSRLNPGNTLTTKGATSWIDRSITLPTEGLIQTPIIIAHEQAHANHMEESRIFKIMKRAYHSGNQDLYKQIRQDGHFIIEGWASFVSGIYARIKDREIGAQLYQKHLVGMLGFTNLIDVFNQTDNRRYYDGYSLFDQILEKYGLESAKSAAYNLTTDEQLRIFSK
jgi:hypothetical protein